jgi:hypothetical protein
MVKHTLRKKKVDGREFIVWTNSLLELLPENAEDLPPDALLRQILSAGQNMVTGRLLLGQDVHEVIAGTNRSHVATSEELVRKFRERWAETRDKVAWCKIPYTWQTADEADLLEEEGARRCQAYFQWALTAGPVADFETMFRLILGNRLLLSGRYDRVRQWVTSGENLIVHDFKISRRVGRMAPRFYLPTALTLARHHDDFRRRLHPGKKIADMILHEPELALERARMEHVFLEPPKGVIKAAGTNVEEWGTLLKRLDILQSKLLPIFPKSLTPNTTISSQEPLLSEPEEGPLPPPFSEEMSVRVVTFAPSGTLPYPTRAA